MSSGAWTPLGGRWLHHDSRVRQALITIAVAAVCLRTVRPLGLSDAGLATALLLVANLAVLSLRLLPEHLAQRVRTVPVYGTSALLVGALMAFDRSGASATFGFFLAGTIGYHRPYVQAVAFAGFVSACSTIGIEIGAAHGLNTTEWYLGALTGVSVLAGISNRSRGAELSQAHAAAESALVAARAEARAQTMAERARIARDVHDVLAHSLAGINMQLEAVDALLENGDTDPAREAAQRAQKLVREGLAEVSRTVRDMREDALPLVETLSSLVAATAPPGTRLEVVGTPRDVPTPRATALTRCAQESLTNARKHAPDADVRVVLTFGAGVTELDVVNGASVHGGELGSTGSGLGLIGMRERVALVGGSVRTGPIVEGEDSGGWRVHVEVPA